MENTGKEVKQVSDKYLAENDFEISTMLKENDCIPDEWNVFITIIL